MSRKLFVAALLAATAALATTPTFAATWHHRSSVRHQSSWQAENTSDPTMYAIRNSIPETGPHVPGITPSTAPGAAASGAYAYEPAQAYGGGAFANDPTMYAVRNSIPDTGPHVPGFGARP